ncbi:uncharacterized protein N0V89_003258 [Didymosphaeria variabile]|uniref:Uncharacterized protein n=1 Tax=Didymosphaeria variabile TaxID=1932322 RepID=A0A9W9CFB2_9PLEO|nr:uncharacterized protein N0V89_003258 [Didymosphaeria variabile]KAJ4358674.1 hypothetical protein N0V89_003258 [Didymosphaeria variabile]
MGASEDLGSSTATATTVLTFPCSGTALPNVCLANSWSNTIAKVTVVPGDVFNMPTDISNPAASSTGNVLSVLPSLTGDVPDTTTVSATTVFTLACTATPLPNDCEVNSWSNTVIEVTATPGQVLVNLPTDLLVTTSPTASEIQQPAGTPGAAMGREVGVIGAVVGGLVAGLVVL